MSSWPFALWKCRLLPEQRPLLSQPLEFSGPPRAPGALPEDGQRAVLQGNMPSPASSFLGVAFTWLECREAL